MYEHDIKLAGKKQNIDPLCKVLVKEVDLGEPTPFIDHVNLGCTQRDCQISKDIVDNYQNMFESRISAGAVEKVSETIGSGNLDANTISPRSLIRKVMQRSAWNYCDLADTTEQVHKVATPCVDDHQFEKTEHGSVGELSTVCSQIVLKCLFLARIGRPDILW